MNQFVYLLNEQDLSIIAGFTFGVTISGPDPSKNGYIPYIVEELYQK